MLILTNQKSIIMENNSTKDIDEHVGKKAKIENSIGNSVGNSVIASNAGGGGLIRRFIPRLPVVGGNKKVVATTAEAEIYVINTNNQITIGERNYRYRCYYQSNNMICKYGDKCYNSHDVNETQLPI